VTKKIGRPSDYTEELAAAVCERMSEGKTLTKVCKLPGMPDRKTVLRWREQFPEFRPVYARARENQADAWGDEIIDDAESCPEDPVAIQKTRVVIDAKKWVMGRVHRKAWGDTDSKKTEEAEDAEKAPDRFVDKPPEETREQWEARVKQRQK
jgi:hypothetical protein